MNKCPKCGQEVASKFCPDCGINVTEPPKCHKCGAVMTGRFCPDCGFDSTKKDKEPNKFVEKSKEIFGKVKEKTVSIFNKCKDYFIANKKRCIIIGTTAIVSLVLLIVLIVNLTNIFRVGKVSKIEIGMSMSEVEKILGEPTLDDEGNWYWYEKKVAKKLKKAEQIEEEFEYIEDEDDFEKFEEKYDKIYAEIEEMTYKFIMVKFDGDDKVREVFFDKHHKYDDSDDYISEEEKDAKKIEISIDSFEGYTETTNGETVAHLIINPNEITYSVKFEDGSYCLNTIYQSSMEITVDGNNCNVKWNDRITSYETTKPFNTTGTIVDGVLTSWNTAAENVVLPESVTDVGTALKGNTTMRQITLPTRITEIKADAFKGCSALETIDIPNGVIKIGSSAFENCTSLSRIIIGKDVAIIGAYAFNGCSNLYEVVNLSDLDIRIGSDENGRVAKNALVVHDSLNSSYMLEKTEDGLFFLVSEENTSLVAYKGIASEITLPETYKEKSYKIRNNIFTGNKYIKSVVLPSFVTTIEEEAFKNCSSLTSITIPSGVTSIGASAFEGCALENITIPESTKYIGLYALYCPSLKRIQYNAVTDVKEGGVIIKSGMSFSLVIGEGVTHIDGTSTFLSHAKDISVHQNNAYYTVIGSDLCSKDGKTLVFHICNGESTFNVPQEVCIIGSFAFSHCHCIKDIIIPDRISSIESNAFYHCDSITSITIPDSVTYIGTSAFCDCDSLKNVVIGNGLTLIESSLFKYCSSLTDVTIGNSVTSINSYAFEECTSLTSITIPDSVTSIGRYAFYVCESLKNIIIPDNVTSVGGGAFSNCVSLTSVTIGKGVTSMGGHSFYGCVSISEINFNATSLDDFGCEFSEIGRNATGITVNIGKNVTKIPDGFFYDSLRDSPKITSVVFEQGSVCKNIGIRAFYGCDSLININIPNTITSIGYAAFSGCDALNFNEYNNAYYLGDETNPYLVLIKAQTTGILSCEINENTRIVYDSAFQNCNSLTSIVIPDSVTYIGNSAFYGCDSITSITIPDSVTYIGNSAFYSCDSLKNVVIGNGLTLIESSLFKYCSSLTDVTIGKSVTSIRSYAFENCTSLKEIIIPGQVTTMGYPFKGCLSSLKIYCEEIVNSGDWSFGWNEYHHSGYTGYYCTVYWYSENEPTGSGNYWHYGDNGEIVVWE